jgi:hypothetical protein
MGNHISIDGTPIQYSSFLKHGNTHGGFKCDYKSNIKAWSFQPDRSDITDTEITPIDFTNFTSFDSKRCYIVLHLFRKGFIAPTSNNVSNENGHNSDHSLFGLAVSTSKQLTPRGLEHRFSINDLQTAFFQDALHHAHGDSLSEVSYDLYLWHGKESTMSLQAAAITRGFEMERKLLEQNLPDCVFESGHPVPILRYFTDDIPPVRSNLANLSHHKTSSVALYMSLYQHSHLFRSLANLNSPEEEPVDEYHDVAFRSLLQLPPLDADETSSGEREETDFLASPRDDDDEAMSTSSDYSDEEDQQKPVKKISPPNVIKMNALKLPMESSTPRKRTVPEGFTESDSKRISSRDSSDTSRGSGSFRLALNSIDRGDNPLDPSPTPRKKLQEIDSTRPMSGSELVVYYRKICSQVCNFTKFLTHVTDS